MKVAIMFSGQGSQYANMGLSFFENNLEKVKQAETILNFDIFKTLKNENNELSQTLYTQTLMTLMMMLIFDEIKDRVKISSLIGFSLGEYSALYASGVYSFENILKIVKYRAQLMDNAAIKYPGKMAAVLTDDLNLINEVIESLTDNYNNLIIANYNARNQYVISGSKESVDVAIDIFKNQGIRRVIPLNVSGGFHSELMSEASQQLNDYLNNIEIERYDIPIYSNVSSYVLKSKDLVEELTLQIKLPVLFYQSIENMIADGITHFIEVGPGKVLSNLVKKNYQVKVYNIENVSDLKDLEEFLC